MASRDRQKASGQISGRRKRGADAYRRGLRAERLAVWLLRLKLYRILGERVKTRAGEIDILARKGRQLVIVEVKARQTMESASEAVQPRQQMRLARAAESLLAKHGPDLDVRFDVIQVVPGRFPVHIPDAWRP